ncbi:hypothetical protein GCM10009592_14460 [Brachybacterium rhamnosum]|uniref:Uncharacterized protein n=1 Tax=Brachybacterium rhamnosum TaxID=173361 RepID=A0ABW4PZY3_9MICO
MNALPDLSTYQSPELTPPDLDDYDGPLGWELELDFEDRFGADCGDAA